MDEDLKNQLAQGAQKAKGHFLKRAPTAVETNIGPPRQRPIDPKTGRRKARTPSERRRDLLAMSELFLLGWTQYEIANYMDLSRVNAEKDMAAIRNMWREYVASNYDRAKADELARLYHIEKMALEAFYESKENAETITEDEPLISEEGEVTKGRRKKKTQGTGGGDPRFLEVARSAVAERCKILGLYAPKQHQIKMQQTVLHLDRLSEEEMKTLERALARQVEAQAGAVGQLTADERGTATGQLPGFAALISRQANLSDAGEPLPADSVPLAAPANHQSGGSGLVSGDVLEAEWQEVPGDGA